MGWLALKKSDIDGGRRTWEGDDSVKVGGFFGGEVGEARETMKKMNVEVPWMREGGGMKKLKNL